MVWRSLTAVAVLAATTHAQGGVLDWTKEEAGQEAYNVLVRFDEFANANSGSRSIINGYDDSAQYIMDVLAQYPDVWSVTVQEFDTVVDNWTGYTQFEDPKRPSLSFPGTMLDFKVCDPVTGFQRYDQSCDYAAVRYGGNGTWDFSSGLDVVRVEGDYTEANFVASGAAGNAALIEASAGVNIRDAAYEAEAANVQLLLVHASADAGNVYGANLYFTDPTDMNLKETLVQVPIVGMTYAMGMVVKNLESLQVAFTGENLMRRVTTRNIIAETIQGDPTNVVFAGAHLDGVAAGAGINDDGSGSAAILAIAERMAQLQQSGDLNLVNQVRFGWWGAEETGIFGSEFYAESLGAVGLENILSYSNFDMLASPNYILNIHRGSDAPAEAQPVAIALQEMFEERMQELGFQEGSGYRLVPMTGGSDFVPFRKRNVPTGGLNTGAGAIKSIQEQADFSAALGGMANIAADPCYHADCDNINNVARPALDVNTYVAGDVLADMAQTANIRKSMASHQFQEASGSIESRRELRTLSWDRDMAGDLAFEALQAFDVAAEQNGGSRSVENGYNASAEYIQAKLDELPNIEYELQFLKVAVDDWSGVRPGADTKIPTIAFPEVEELQFKGCEASTGYQKFALSCDFAGVRYGGNGDYNFASEEIEFVPSAGASAADFSSANGKIALISSVVAPASMLDVAYAAEDAGVLGLLIYNAASQGGIYGTRLRTVAYIEGDRLVQIPVIGMTHAMGMAIREFMSRGLESVQVVANNEVRIVQTYNVIASTVRGSPDSVIMCGAHLDSVAYGAGINDDGSGSAAILAIAQTLDADITAGTVNLVNKARFGWWGSEEIGLLGSRLYVNELVANGEEDTIALYSNYDMIAGPNFYLGIHRGEDAQASARASSTTLQKLYEDEMVSMNENYELSGMTGGSDFLPFLEAGIPTGGLLTGAGGRKSTEEVPLWGGFANAQYDPCYHAECDNIDNIAIEALRTNTYAAGNIMLELVEKPNVRTFLDSSAESDDGLGAGAIAGIVVGVFGVLGLAGGAYVYTSKKKGAGDQEAQQSFLKEYREM